MNNQGLGFLWAFLSSAFIWGENNFFSHPKFSDHLRSKWNSVKNQCLTDSLHLGSAVCRTRKTRVRASVLQTFLCSHIVKLWRLRKDLVRSWGKKIQWVDPLSIYPLQRAFVYGEVGTQIPAFRGIPCSSAFGYDSIPLLLSPLAQSWEGTRKAWTTLTLLPQTDATEAVLGCTAASPSRFQSCPPGAGYRALTVCW